MDNAQDKYSLLCALVEDHYPILAPTWRAAPGRFGARWIDMFMESFETAFGSVADPSKNPAAVSAIDGYAEFCNDSLRSQVYFEQTGNYPAKNYDTCVDEFYLNKTHMETCYLPGMWISHLIWPQHYNMLRGFLSGHLSNVAEQTSLFYEVGVGCGMYSVQILRELPHTYGVGFDISEFSLGFTSEMVAKSGFGERYTIENRDIKNTYQQQCDLLVCQEVLEHLDNPEEFCVWLAAMVRPGGFAYVTAALNAAHSDHIYRFSNPLEVESMIRHAGLQPIGLQEEFAPGSRDRDLTPSLAGFFAQKAL
jgi:SAM-dependent methyltransferase